MTKKRHIENRIIRALNGVCDALLFENIGFCWLTHFVDLSDVSHSLRIVCVFDTDLLLREARSRGLIETIPDLAMNYLSNENIVVANIDQKVFFDSEDNGADINNPGWCRKYI